MKTGNRAGFILLCGIAASAVFLAGCRVTLPEPGALTVDGVSRTAADVAAGFIATVDCSPEVSGLDMHATEVGTTSYGTMKLVNSGDAEVVINGAELILTDSDGTPTTHQQSYFSWAGQAPDLPLTLAAGGSATFTVAFCSDVGGKYYACLSVNTSDGYQQVRLTGEAGWVVTLMVTSTNTFGKITAPFTVTKADVAGIVYLCTDSTLTLTAETDDPVALTELTSWSVTGSASLSSTTELTTVATITGNTAVITANFTMPYLTITADLVGAVATYNGGGYKGIAMATGVYTLTAAVVLPQCILRGGYNLTFDTRLETYKTEAGRAAGTRISTAGYDFTFYGSTVTSDSLLEGIQVTAGDGTTGPYAALGVVNGASPTLRYCTFIGGGGTADNSIGLYILGAAGTASSPVVDACVIRGGDTTADKARSVGLWTTFNCAPTVTNCTISAGAASGGDGKSYGVLNSSYAASPIITGCSIDGGGSAGSPIAAAFWTGEGGRPRIEGNALFTRNAAISNYGVYLYSNGRLDTLFGNNIHGCSTALLFDYSHDQKVYTSIDDVNEDFVTGSQEANTSAAP